MAHQESTETELLDYFKAKKQKAQAECEREVAILRDIESNAQYRIKALEYMDRQSKMFTKFAWLLVILNVSLALILLKLVIA